MEQRPHQFGVDDRALGRLVQAVDDHGDLSVLRGHSAPWGNASLHRDSRRRHSPAVVGIRPSQRFFGSVPETAREQTQYHPVMANGLVGQRVRPYVSPDAVVVVPGIMGSSLESESGVVWGLHRL